MPHTPGPWRVDGSSEDPPIYIRADSVGGFYIAECYPAAGGDDDPTDANARLLAAAPRLLRAFESIIALSGAFLLPQTVRAANALIAEIKGS